MNQRPESRLSACEKRYVEVAVALPVSKTLTYEVPVSLRPMAGVGKRVLVPVRKSQVTGYILDHADTADYEDVKEISDILDEVPIFPHSIIPFFRWIADYYLYPIGEVINGALPGGLNITQVQIVSITQQGRAAIADGQQLGAVSQNMLKVLENRGPITVKTLSSVLDKKVSPSRLASLE